MSPPFKNGAFIVALGLASYGIPVLAGQRLRRATRLVFAFLLAAVVPLGSRASGQGPGAPPLEPWEDIRVTQINAEPARASFAALGDHESHNY
jgi:hypothetical protein